MYYTPRTPPIRTDPEIIRLLEWIRLELASISRAIADLEDRVTALEP